MRFTVERGGVTREVIVDKVSVRFGSDSACDVVLDDPEVAPLHGELALRRHRELCGSLTAHAPILVNGEPFTNQRIQILDRLRFGTTRVIVQTLDEPKGMTIVDDSPSRPFATYNPPMPLEFVRSIVARPERELVHGASGTAEDSLLWTIDSALPSGVLRAPAEPGLAIANDPGDAATREVYADLLIERGHADAAACVRGSNRDAGTPRWRAIVARGPITACSNQRCRNDWSRLLAVRVDGAIDIRERICDVCDDHVHYCTDRESVHWASTGQFRRVIDPAAEP